MAGLVLFKPTMFDYNSALINEAVFRLAMIAKKPLF